MADIDIVPKKRSATWVWVLLAVVVLAVIIWMLMGRAPSRTTRGDTTVGHPVAVAVALRSQAVG
jgi:bacteriorhodopsin